jgi:hypothetical protein
MTHSALSEELLEKCLDELLRHRGCNTEVIFCR